jgi:hypothetical protein
MWWRWASRPSGWSERSTAYTTSEARQELLDTVEEAAHELGFTSTCLAEA